MASNSTTNPPIVPPHATILQFKFQKLTIFLPITSGTYLSTIKSTLLSALQARNVTTIGAYTVPSSPSEIRLGVQALPDVATSNWNQIPDPDDGDEGNGVDGAESEDELATATTTTKKRRRATKGSGEAFYPDVFGLKDGGCVAFKFVEQQEEFEVDIPSLDEEEEEEA